MFVRSVLNACFLYHPRIFAPFPFHSFSQKWAKTFILLWLTTRQPSLVHASRSNVQRGGTSTIYYYHSHFESSIERTSLMSRQLVGSYIPLAIHIYNWQKWGAFSLAHASTIRPYRPFLEKISCVFFFGWSFQIEKLLSYLIYPYSRKVGTLLNNMLRAGE